MEKQPEIRLHHTVLILTNTWTRCMLVLSPDVSSSWRFCVTCFIPGAAGVSLRLLLLLLLVHSCHIMSSLFAVWFLIRNHKHI